MASDRNTGYLNAGNLNTGDLNAGNLNAGDRNTGNWNAGDRNTGFFCVDTPSPMFFDSPWDGTWKEAIALMPYVDLPCGVEWVPLGDMSEAEKEQYPNHTAIGGYLKKHLIPLRESFPSAWGKMDTETRKKFTTLPNFDAEKFLAITGVDIRTSLTPDIIEINGVQYRRVASTD